jgi:hypothetical protein
MTLMTRANVYCMFGSHVVELKERLGSVRSYLPIADPSITPRARLAWHRSPALINMHMVPRTARRKDATAHQSLSVVMPETSIDALADGQHVTRTCR